VENLRGLVIFFLARLSRAMLNSPSANPFKISACSRSAGASNRVMINRNQQSGGPRGSDAQRGFGWAWFSGQRRGFALATLLAVCLAGWRMGAAESDGDGHWAFKPLAEPAAPEIQRSDWVRNPIDSFVLARLEESGLGPSPEADRAILVRRLYFDLTGLPPTPGDIDRFVNDASPRAYEELVDRLLASPFYGERWARHWLDVARYTESQGYEYDHMRANAWHYRDYVIRSLNADKPYDQFMREQIAGDVMEPVTTDGIVATSLLVCGPWDQAGNSQANATQRAITREEELEDLVSVVSQSFLGVTVNCARCHNHKFDPIPQEDYYRIKSVFEGVRHGERTVAPPETIKRREQKIDELKAALAGVNRGIRELEARGRERVVSTRRPGAVGALPAPMALWTFDEGPNDSVGSLRGRLHGDATVSSGRLILDGKDDFLESDPVGNDFTEKTLEVWVALSNLEQSGGGALSVETLNGSVFDAIVFGEREAGKWTAGSEGFARTRDLKADPESAEAAAGMTQMVVVYDADGRITVYRNGRAHGESYPSGQSPRPFKTGEARILIGKRHSGGGKPFLAAEIEQAAVYDRALSPEEVAASFSAAGHYVRSEEAIAALSSEELAKREGLLQQVATLRSRLDAVAPVPVSYAGNRVQPGPTRRLERGDVRQPAETVSPGAISSIRIQGAVFELAPDASEGERRLKFSEWLADPRNPLPARAMVNRVWHYHFGRGIVSTPNDLGASGAPPTHPALLDWLATHLIREGWSLKSLHRTILCSATYRQASDFSTQAARIDTENTLLWRFSPQRLEAEPLRDAMLAVGGFLNLEQFGPSFRPFDTRNFGATFYLLEDKTGPEFDRRTVYRMNINSGKDPLLEAFDAPDPSIKTPRRGVTTTPLQALGLMNNSFVQRQADRFAERLLRESGGRPEEAVDLAYRHAFGRHPDAAERERAVAVATAEGMQTVCWALFNSTEFLHVR
jgi:hypothetical protein